MGVTILEHFSIRGWGIPHILCLVFYLMYLLLRFFLSCDTCFRAKQIRAHFSINSNKESEIFSLIHCDVWGLTKLQHIVRINIFLTILDYFSRVIWIFLMHENGEDLVILTHFCQNIQTQFHKTIKST